MSEIWLSYSYCKLHQETMQEEVKYSLSLLQQHWSDITSMAVASDFKNILPLLTKNKSGLGIEHQHLYNIYYCIVTSLLLSYMDKY